MTIQNFFTSRDNNANANSYVGQQDRLWYNINLNAIYVSDGNTPGGIPVGLATGANAIFDNIAVNNIGNDDSTEVKFTSDVTFDDEITVNGNAVIIGNISPATTTKIGGVRAGPGANISADGLLTIDTSGLPLSFGDFTANNNILTLVNVDQDMILATQGNAEIQLVGNIGFYKSNGLPPDPNNLFFFAQDDGQIKIFVPTSDPLAGAVEIIGSTSGTSVPPAQTGVMLHITGNPNSFSSQYIDGANSFPNYIGRRYNGTPVSPTQVLAGDVIVRFSGQGYSTGGFNAPADGTISLDALENFTQSNQGAIWRFSVNAVGGNTRQEVANISVANGVTATQFTTAGNVTATGNVSGGNIIINSGGLISSTGLITTTGNIAAGNVNSYVTLTAGTTSKDPLVFATGSLTTVPTVGAMAYDGQLFYATPLTSQRGLLKSVQTYILNADYNIVNQTGVQSMFGVSTAVSSNTRYAYVINAVVYKTANNITMSYALDGGATLARHTYQTTTTATAALATLTTPSIVKNILTTGFDTPVVVTAALNGTGYYGIQVFGTVNVTTGGTWNPLIAFSGLPGTGSYVAAGSSVELYPLGPGNATVSIGNWS